MLRPTACGRPATNHSLQQLRGVRCAVRVTAWRGAAQRVRCMAKAAAAAPPRPHSRFSKADLRRIKGEGPRIGDLVLHHEVQREDDGKQYTSVYDFVPYEVLGPWSYAPEPSWYSTPEVSFMEFHHGLQQRNWTSPHYDPSAAKWDVQLFTDSGRFMRPAFKGYRAYVTRPDGPPFWADLSDAGQRTFLGDYLSGGSKGAIFTAKRVAPKGLPHQYGANQVLEELFAAHEQQVPPSARRQLEKQQHVSPSPPYTCPSAAHLSVSFHRTPNEVSLAEFWRALPAYLFYGFAFSFLGVCLALGIFAPKRQMPSDYAQAMEFAQSKGKARKEGMTNVRFDQVAGIDAVRDELMECVNFLTNPTDQRWQKLGAKPPKGVLLEGPPGTGKTLIAKAVAGEAGVPFYQMTGSEFVEIIVGVGAARVRDLFKRARVNAPCIIFVDEIDALGIRRAEAGSRTNEEREQTLNQLLTEIDGFEVEKNPVVFMAATNRADLLDPALLRAGRFDRKIRVTKPDTQGRYDILKVHSRKRAKHLAVSDAEMYQLAKDLPGLSGAELENILNEAALEALRQGADSITREHVYSAVDRVMQGVRRPPLPDTFAIKRSMAVYECGRALAAEVLRRRHGRLEQVERISMVPRGGHWTRTLFLRGDDEAHTSTTRGHLLDRLRVLLAGRAAEQIAYGSATTYGTRDLTDAARLAEKVVAHYGLSDAGILTYAHAPRPLDWGRQKFETGVDTLDEDLFGRGISGGLFQPSDATVDKTKRAVMRLLLDAFRDNLELLESHKAALESATERLLAQEIVMGAELAGIVDDNPPQAVQAVAVEMGEAFEIAAAGATAEAVAAPNGAGNGEASAAARALAVGEQLATQ